MFIVTQDAALSPCSGLDAHGSSLSTETGSSRTIPHRCPVDQRG
jgi:hypothetical protein